MPWGRINCTGMRSDWLAIILKITWGAAALIALLDRDSEAVKAHSDSLMDLALKGKVPPWAIGMARGYEGAAMVESGQVEGGLSLMRDSSVSWRRLWGAHTFPLECVYYDAMSRTGAS